MNLVCCLCGVTFDRHSQQTGHAFTLGGVGDADPRDATIADLRAQLATLRTKLKGVLDRLDELVGEVVES